MKEEKLDDEIQQVVTGLLALPREVLLRQLTYWSADIENGEYGMDSELAYMEWKEMADCYATAETEPLKYMHAGCMALKMGSMLQDIKGKHLDQFVSALSAVKSRMGMRYVYLKPTMNEEIDRTWLEPVTWEEGRAAGLAYTPLVRTFMQQYETGKMKEAASNVLYLLKRIGKLWCHKPRLFDPDSDRRVASYEMLMEVACYILARITKDERTKTSLKEDIPWHLRTINMMYKRMFDLFDLSFDNFIYMQAEPEEFITGYYYFMED